MNKYLKDYQAAFFSTCTVVVPNKKEYTIRYIGYEIDDLIYLYEPEHMILAEGKTIEDALKLLVKRYNLTYDNFKKQGRTDEFLQSQEDIEGCQILNEQLDKQIYLAIIKDMNYLSLGLQPKNNEEISIIPPISAPNEKQKAYRFVQQS